MQAKIPHASRAANEMLRKVLRFRDHMPDRWKLLIGAMTDGVRATLTDAGLLFVQQEGLLKRSTNNVYRWIYITNHRSTFNPLGVSGRNLYRLDSKYIPTGTATNHGRSRLVQTEGAGTRRYHQLPAARRKNISNKMAAKRFSNLDLMKQVDA